MKKIFLNTFLFSAILCSGTFSAQTETSGREPVYRATHTQTTELKHTKLKVKFDYEKEQMSGEAWISATPYFYPSDSLVLNAKAMLIHEVAIDKNGSRSPLKYSYQNDILHINLDKTYQKNQEYTVFIKYTARPNEVKQKGSAAITDAKGLYFINAQGKDPDKPTQIWTQGETESSSVWFPTIDKPNMKTTQEIYMTVPDKYVTLSNGYLKSSVKESGGLRTDHWVMDKKHAPYLFFMGVGDYAIVKDKWRNIPVDYYVEKEYEPFAKQIFGNTPEMMEFFSKKLKYDYPWNKYAQITARDYVSGAMENTTAVLHSDAAQQKPEDLIDENRWEDVITHELFHHWFGDLVTTESWSQLSMNESFANYSEYLWNEHKYGRDFADYGLMIAIQGYLMDPANISKDLIRFNYHAREDMFDAVSYNKGGAILHMLRHYVGDEAFWEGMNHYLKTNEYGTGEAHQFRLSLEKITGKDLNWFFNQWFFGSGHPKLSFTSSFDPVKKELTVSVNQTQSEYFQFPLAIDIFENGKAVRKNVWINARSKNDFRFPVSKNADLINLNADGILLAEISENKTPEQYLLQYNGSENFLSRYRALEGAEKTPDHDAAAKTLAAALKDKNFRIRMKALNVLDLSKASHAKATLSEVEKLAESDPKTLVQSAAIAALRKTRNQKYLALYEKKFNTPSSAVKATSLAGIISLDPAKIKDFAAQVDLEKASEEVIATLLPAIVQNKVEKQMHAIGSTVAFYPFIRFQDPQLGATAEEGFHWIMDSDNTKATESVTKILIQAKRQLGENPQARMMILNMLKDGLSRKMQTLKSNPGSTSLHQQVELINKAIAAYQQ